MFCTKCGAAVPQNSNFCAKCGQDMQSYKDMPRLDTFYYQQNSYFSTPKHNKSFIGKFLYIYVAKGVLCLTAESLNFTSSKAAYNIPYEAITNIRIGHYSRLAKPIRLDYISVAFINGEIEETILLTPTVSWATSVWETNKMVLNCVNMLNALKESKLKSRTVNS